MRLPIADRLIEVSGGPYRLFDLRSNFTDTPAEVQLQSYFLTTRLVDIATAGTGTFAVLNDKDDTIASIEVASDAEGYLIKRLPVRGSIAMMITASVATYSYLELDELTPPPYTLRKSSTISTNPVAVSSTTVLCTLSRGDKVRISAYVPAGATLTLLDTMGGTSTVVGPSAGMVVLLDGAVSGVASNNSISATSAGGTSYISCSIME